MDRLIDVKSLDRMMIDLLVKQMLNPNNKDFYIGNLTVEQVKELFVEMQQDCIDITTVFWTAFSVAQSTLIAEQEYKEQIIKEYEEICILENDVDEYTEFELLAEQQEYEGYKTLEDLGIEY